MTKTKIVIICLILVVAIFCVGLSLNLIDKPGHEIGNSPNPEENNRAAASYSGKSWVKGIDNLLSPFASSVKVNELSFSCPHSAQSFELNAQMPSCVITVVGFSEPFKKLTLIPNNRNLTLNIAFKPEKGKEPGSFSWPSKQSNDDKINFVLLGEKDLKGEMLAAINVECTACVNQSRVTITFE